MDRELQVLERQLSVLSKILDEASMMLALLEGCRIGRITVPPDVSLLACEQDSILLFERAQQIIKASKETLFSIKKIQNKKGINIAELDHLNSLLDSCSKMTSATDLQLASRLLHRTTGMYNRRLEFYHDSKVSLQNIKY